MQGILSSGKLTVNTDWLSTGLIIFARVAVKTGLGVYVAELELQNVDYN